MLITWSTGYYTKGFQAYLNAVHLIKDMKQGSNYDIVSVGRRLFGGGSGSL